MNESTEGQTPATQPTRKRPTKSKTERAVAGEKRKKRPVSMERVVLRLVPKSAFAELDKVSKDSGIAKGVLRAAITGEYVERVRSAIEEVGEVTSIAQIAEEMVAKRLERLRAGAGGGGGKSGGSDGKSKIARPPVG